MAGIMIRVRLIPTLHALEDMLDRISFVILLRTILLGFVAASSTRLGAIGSADFDWFWQSDPVRFIVQ